MSASVKTFEQTFNDKSIRDSFKRITKLEVIGNESAFISFVGCLYANRNFQASQENYRQIQELDTKVNALKPIEKKKNPWQ